MFRSFLLVLATILMAQITPAPLAAQGNCALCDLAPKDRKCFSQDGTLRADKKGCEKFLEDPIALTIESDIDFGRLIMIGSGQGSVLIDIETGTKTVIGDLDDLGGIAMQGQAVVTGRPLRAVTVNFPNTVILRDPAGGAAELREFQTNLPVQAILDANGRLEFSFTGTLYTGDAITVGGNLRGRVPIHVEYD